MEGREGGTWREKGKKKERNREEKRERYKKSNRCGTYGATHQPCVHSEKVSFSPVSVPSSAQLPPPLMHRHPNIPSRKRAVATVQGKDAIMSVRQRSISPWLFIGLPER